MPTGALSTVPALLTWLDQLRPGWQGDSATLVLLMLACAQEYVLEADNPVDSPAGFSAFVSGGGIEGVLAGHSAAVRTAFLKGLAALCTASSVPLGPPMFPSSS